MIFIENEPTLDDQLSETFLPLPHNSALILGELTYVVMMEMERILE